MKRRIVLAEFSIFDQFPLISGYLHAYARADAGVAKAFEFVHYQREVERVSYAETLSEIRSLRANIVCFSAYVWNMGLVRRLMNDLRQDSNIQHVILGGHQVSNQIRQYASPWDQKTIVINGQGEIPFRSCLQRIAAGKELAGLRGVSFFVDGELHDGGEAEALMNLDEIPSPFLGGIFDQMRHPITVFETNRGCPYKCTFCTWGGDTLKVAKFSLDRVKEELLWIARKSVLFIHIADANWGMLPRDVEISEHIGRLKKDYGSPWMVYYAAAENKPKGSIACIEKFHEGGVITSQAIGIQSMNPDTLTLVDRQNIRNTAFIEMFKYLDGKGIDSYCELIWPLPGETFATLKSGFEQLVELGAPTTIMYPAILINNARLTAQADEFEIESLQCDDWKSELKLVKKTQSADRAAVDAGFWFYYSYFLLANCDAHKALLKYLCAITGRGHADIIEAFAIYLRDNASTSAYAQTIAAIFGEEAHGSLLTIGRIATHLTHEQRASAIEDAARFVLTKLLANDMERGMAIVSLWAFALPRLFMDTSDGVHSTIKKLDAIASDEELTFSKLAAVHSAERTITMDLGARPSSMWPEAVKFFGSARRDEVSSIHVTHPRVTLMPYSVQDAKRNYKRGVCYEHFTPLPSRVVGIRRRRADFSYMDRPCRNGEHAGHRGTARAWPPFTQDDGLQRLPYGWYPEVLKGMEAVSSAQTKQMQQSPMYQRYYAPIAHIRSNSHYCSTAWAS